MAHWSLPDVLWKSPQDKQKHPLSSTSDASYTFLLRSQIDEQQNDEQQNDEQQNDQQQNDRSFMKSRRQRPLDSLQSPKSSLPEHLISIKSSKCLRFESFWFTRNLLFRQGNISLGILNTNVTNQPTWSNSEGIYADGSVNVMALVSEMKKNGIKGPTQGITPGSWQRSQPQHKSDVAGIWQHDCQSCKSLMITPFYRWCNKTESGHPRERFDEHADLPLYLSSHPDTYSAQGRGLTPTSSRIR